MQNTQQSGDNPVATAPSVQAPTSTSGLPETSTTKREFSHHTGSGTSTPAKSESGKPFADIAPSPNKVDPAELLDTIFNLIRRYMVMSVEQSRAATLWIAMTWFIDDIKVAPLAIITAPERECGKSVLLELFSFLVARPLSVANSSAPFLFRAIQAWMVTLLIDEADMFAHKNDELKGLINAGHTRASAFVGRVVKVGDSLEPRTFSVWCGKALAGIRLEKHLPDSTMSRGIVFNLRRKRTDESAERLRHADQADIQVLASKLARFAQDYKEQVGNARPDLPAQLSDRAQDNWESLFAIAACAGPEWIEYTRVAALSLSANTTGSDNIGTELLADIQDIFEQKMIDRISSSDLLTALITNDPEAPWSNYNRGKPLTARQLSRMLAPYDIHSKTVRFGPSTPKGFEFAQFKDAFSRYLSASPKAEASIEAAPIIVSNDDWPDNENVF